MATNKNAALRYRALDKCFSNPYKRFFINDLIEHCSAVLSEHYSKEVQISRRQILDDIDFMRSQAGFDAPIESCKEGRTVYYRYEDKEFSILKKPLTNTEEAQLKQTLETLGRIKGIAGMDWINSIQAKISSGLNLSHQNRNIIEFEENEYLKGIEFLNPLYQYIISKQSLAIAYKPYKSSIKYPSHISPYYLKQYNNRWFLFGWNHQLNKLQNLALDRIESINLLNGKYTKTDIDFNEYFEDIIGVTNDETQQVEEVLMELSENIIPYVKSKPIHNSQILKGNILKIRVKLNYELETLILSHGENMKVISPKDLRSKIAERTKKTNNFY